MAFESAERPFEDHLQRYDIHRHFGCLTEGDEPGPHRAATPCGGVAHTFLLEVFDHPIEVAFGVDPTETVQRRVKRLVLGQ